MLCHAAHDVQSGLFEPQLCPSEVCDVQEVENQGWQKPGPVQSGVPRHWGSVRCGCIEGVLAIAILAGQHPVVWDAAGMLLREHFKYDLPFLHHHIASDHRGIYHPFCLSLPIVQLLCHKPVTAVWLAEPFWKSGSKDGQHAMCCLMLLVMVSGVDALHQCQSTGYVAM